MLMMHGFYFNMIIWAVNQNWEAAKSLLLKYLQWLLNKKLETDFGGNKAKSASFPNKFNKDISNTCSFDYVNIYLLISFLFKNSYKFIFALKMSVSNFKRSSIWSIKAILLGSFFRYCQNKTLRIHIFKNRNSIRTVLS